MTSRLTRIATLLAAFVVVTVAAGAGTVDAAAPAADSGLPRSGSTSSDAGQLIVFERLGAEEEQRDLFTIEPDGDRATFLRSPGDYPHWSPDGSELAFLACMNPPDCTTALALLERATGDVRWFLSPDPELEMACSLWAPSGRRVACSALSETERRNGIYTIRASDGKGLTRITRNPGGEDGPLAYSPDGTKLLIVRVDPSRREPANQALFVVPVSGGRAHRITPWGFADDWAGWSPDGRSIVFGTNGSLYRVSPAGHGLARIRLQTEDPASARAAFDVSFSPDGHRLVFSLARPSGIYTARPDGSCVKRLTRSPTEDHHANWGPTPAS